MRPKQSPVKSGKYSMYAVSKQRKAECRPLDGHVSKATSGPLSRGRSRGRPHHHLQTAPFLSPLQCLTTGAFSSSLTSGETLHRDIPWTAPCSLFFIFLPMLCLTLLR